MGQPTQYTDTEQHDFHRIEDLHLLNVLHRNRTPVALLLLPLPLFLLLLSLVVGIFPMVVRLLITRDLCWIDATFYC